MKGCYVWENKAMGMEGKMDGCKLKQVPFQFEGYKLIPTTQQYDNIIIFMGLEWQEKSMFKSMSVTK